MKVIFTEHAKDRIRKRKINEEEVIDIIRYPEKILKREGKYYAQKNIGRAKIEVVYQENPLVLLHTKVGNLLVGFSGCSKKSDSCFATIC